MKHVRRRIPSVSMISLSVVLAALAVPARGEAPDGDKPLKVFILAGDENVLEQAPIEGRTDGVHRDFYPNPEPTSGEKVKHVNCAVYAGRYSADADYDKARPIAKGLVEIGDQRTRQINPQKRGREPVPYTPFPKQAMIDGHTTVLRGYLSVKYPGRYELLAGQGEASLNVTTLAGREVYRRETKNAKATVTAVRLEPRKRYAFRTVFLGKPGHDFRVPLVNKPGTLATVADEDKAFAHLRDKDGRWVTRDDVVLYDAHPIHNNTKAIGRFLSVGAPYRSGGAAYKAVGAELSLGHALGEHFDEPVLLLRFGTRHPIWFLRGSRSLGHDYLPPSSGGTQDHDGNWDVIHFNWGIWDTAYRDPKPGNRWHSDKHTGKITMPIDEYEKNLRKLVARMKKTGATLIWATVTPIHEDCPGRFKEDAPRYNAVAARIMKENGVLIDDLYAESIRQGYPKRPDVHSVGDLAPKVTAAIRSALKHRKHKTKPLPRVLLIGDSITGSYQKGVMAALDGEAFVCKNPGNAEHTGTGVAKIDEWLDLERYLLNGQEYLELVDGVKSAMDNLRRVYPGYAGRKARLAGLVWFQGIRDCQSEAMSAAYAKHLPNLIRDLRKDFDAPNLPVVVAAVGFGAESRTPYVKKVYEAQMAVGDAGKFPEFRGNVRSVDTRPFFPSRELSPGGSSACYYNNAKAYLQIGDAAGRAMIELIER